MFKLLWRKLKFFIHMSQPSNSGKEDFSGEKMSPISGNLEKDLEYIRSAMGYNKDLISREFIIGFQQKIKAAVLMIRWAGR